MRIQLRRSELVKPMTEESSENRLNETMFSLDK